MTVIEQMPIQKMVERQVEVVSELPPNPHLVIRPTKGLGALNLLEIWQFRDLLFTLAGRDLKLRYKQTALGAIWVVLQPLMAAGIFTVVFGKIAKLSSEGFPYFAFAFAGQLGWGLFSGMVTKTSGCLVGNAHLISKVFFPRFVLPLSNLPSSLVDFGIATIMMAVIMMCYHLGVSIALLTLPLWILLLLAMSIGIGLLTSALSVTYRDVGYILPVFMQMLMYASPVAYGATSVPESIKPYYLLNPMSPILEGFRWSVLGSSSPDWRFVGYASAMSVICLVVGVVGFKRMERQFADVV